MHRPGESTTISTSSGASLLVRRAGPADDSLAGDLCARVFSEEVGAKVADAIRDLGIRTGHLGSPREFSIHAAYWLGWLPDREELAGMVGLYSPRWIGNQVLYLGWFGVSPELQGRGVGSSLLRFAVKEARTLGARSLMTETTSEPAETIRFYERMGFVKCGECPDYWEDGSELLLYHLAI